MNKKQKKAIVIGVVIVLVIFLFKFNLPLSILNFDFPYSKSLTFNNYPAIAKSTHQFGEFEDKKDGLLYSGYYNRINPNFLEILRARYEVGGYAEQIQTFITTTDLNLNPETLDKLEFNFNARSSVNVGGGRTLQGGYIGVYLVSKSGKTDVILIRSKNVYYPDHPTYEENGKVTLTKQNGEFVLSRRGSEDIINIPEDEYEIAIYGYATNTIDWVGSERHFMQVTGLNIVKKVVQKETYFRLSENACVEIEIYPSEKTINDYDTLEECEANKKECITDKDCEALSVAGYKCIENKCEFIEPTISPVWIVLGLIAFVGILIFIFLKLRK